MRQNKRNVRYIFEGEEQEQENNKEQEILIKEERPVLLEHSRDV